MIVNLLLIAVIVVLIVDVSGFADEVKKELKRWLGIKNIREKPLFCSLCLTHWIGLVYLLFAGWSLKYYALLLVISCMTTTISSAFYLIKDLIDRLIVFIDKKV